VPLPESVAIKALGTAPLAQVLNPDLWRAKLLATLCTAPNDGLGLGLHPKRIKYLPGCHQIPFFVCGRAVVCTFTQSLESMLFGF